jgi:quinol monooxygenase YgiN
MSKYLLHGYLKAKPGSTNELTDLMLKASQLMQKAKGCKLYLIGTDETDPNSVWITELWETKEDHANSLRVEGVMDLIQKVMPILGEEPKKGQEINILGGL